MTGEWDFHASGDGFSEHDFAGAADLPGDAGFHGTDLSGTDLHSSDLSGTDGHDVGLHGADPQDYGTGHEGTGHEVDGHDFAVTGYQDGTDLAAPDYGTDHSPADYASGDDVQGDDVPGHEFTGEDHHDAYDLGGHGYVGDHEYVDDHTLIAGHDVAGAQDAVSGHDFGSFDHFTDAGIHGGGYDLAGADPQEDNLWSQLMTDLHEDVNPFATR